MATALEQALAAIGTPGGFATTFDLDVGEFSVSVGNRALPARIDNATRKRLVKAAHRAMYGKGTLTLLDTSVRDTWEIAAREVQLSGKALIDAELNRVRDHLGLADSCTLEARLHNLLVYGPGQFFAPHQDGEKHDGMIGTLLVILPSLDSSGGELIVTHGRRKETFFGHDRRLTIVAFYADCRHEVKPLLRGSRVALTFNLVASGDTGVRAPLAFRQARNLSRSVDAHFKTERRGWRATAPAPDRLVYLLEHEYTERGLAWGRLKNGDAMRAAALRTVAEELDLEVALAQADVRETWQCETTYDGWRTRGRAEEGEPVELIESQVTLLRLVRDGGEAQAVQSRVDGDELIQTSDSRALTPYQSEYEGYQGNYGDTADRWYHRGAIVLSPRARAFAIRAKDSPDWAMSEVARAQRAGDLENANRMVSELLPNWSRAVSESSPKLESALTMATGTGDVDLASRLVAPFGVHSLSASAAPQLAKLIAAFGERAREVCAAWFEVEKYGYDHGSWLPKLPELLRGLPASNSFARALARAQVDWLSTFMTERASVAGQRELFKHLTPAAVAVLECAAVAGAPLRARVFELFEPGAGASRLLWFAQILTGVHRRLSAAERTAVSLDDLRAGVARELRSVLGQPERAPDDWSIQLGGNCKCELCAVLGTFLADRSKTVLEWPLAEQRRRHVHSIIDLAALPVTHETRRTGRPLTLVLEKQRALFDDEKKLRKKLARAVTQLEK